MRVLTLMFLLLTAGFGVTIFTGCGAIDEDDSNNHPMVEITNNRPVIETIKDQTVDEGDTIKVKGRITDADANLITVKATSNNTNVARIMSQNFNLERSSDPGTVGEVTLTIKAISVGNATITVSATDSSDQDNAAATPVTFRVTVKVVNIVPAKPSYTDLQNAKNNDEFQEILDASLQGIELKEGLIFPRDTFAVNAEKTILIAHTADGTGIVRQGGLNIIVAGDIHFRNIEFIKEGDVRILRRYAP